jgi:hypothetical protein
MMPEDKSLDYLKDRINHAFSELEEKIKPLTDEICVGVFIMDAGYLQLNSIFKNRVNQLMDLLDFDKFRDRFLKQKESER